MPCAKATRDGFPCPSARHGKGPASSPPGFSQPVPARENPSPFWRREALRGSSESSAFSWQGCVSVPLSIKLLEEEIPFRLNHSEARAILTTRNQLKKVLGSFRQVQNNAIQLIYLDDDPEEARRAASELGIDGTTGDRLRRGARRGEGGHGDRQGLTRAGLASVEEDDTVTICYTSGTTGNPKGIMLTHLNYWTNCHDA